jgi:hypothetical protein
LSPQFGGDSRKYFVKTNVSASALQQLEKVPAQGIVMVGFHILALSLFFASLEVRLQVVLSS